MESEYETAPKLSDGTNLNELDWLLTQISRSRYYSSQITQKLYKIELYIYNCGPIESRIWSIERRRFQWPCTTPNPVFQGHAILWRWISHKRSNIRPYLLWKANRKPHDTCLNDLQWPFQGHDYSTWNNLKIIQQWPTNRKSYMIYRTTPFSTTLNDPCPQF